MKAKAAALLFATTLALPAAPVRAAVLEPSKAVPSTFFSGRWYEIARLPTKSQKECEASVSQFKGADAAGNFAVTQTCRVGALDGPLKSVDVTGKITSGANNTKFTLTFFKVVKQEYWVIDRGEALDWAVMATPGGKYAWLLSRKPTLPVPILDAVVARLKAAGFSTDKLIYPKQPGD